MPVYLYGVQYFNIVSRDSSILLCWYRLDYPGTFEGVQAQLNFPSSASVVFVDFSAYSRHRTTHTPAEGLGSARGFRVDFLKCKAV
jgi:hypothetical protein